MKEELKDITRILSNLSEVISKISTEINNTVVKIDKLNEIEDKVERASEIEKIKQQLQNINDKS